MTLIDTFTDTDGTDLASHTPDAGGSWTEHSSFSSGAVDVRSNRARPGTGESCYYHSTAVDRNFSINAKVRRVGSSTSGMYGGVCAVQTAAKTIYEIDMQTTGLYLGKYVAGSFTALGQYLFVPTADTTYTVAVVFTSSTVTVYLDGTNRISVSDSAVSPTRFGVYGGSNTTSAGFHIDDFSIPLQTYTADARVMTRPTQTYTADANVSASTPPDGTVAVFESGTHDGVVCGTDKYGRITLVAEHTKVSYSATGIAVRRSADGGSTWATVSSGVTVSNISGDNWKVIDARPILGSQPQAAYGSGSVKYELTMTNSSGDGPNATTGTVTASLDPTNVIKAQAEAAATYRAGLGTNYVPTSSMLQPGQWLMTDAYSFYRATVAGWSGASSYLTNCSNQWTYIKSLAQSSGAASGLLCLDGVTSTVETDAHFRPIMHAMECVQLLRASGDATAITLADDMVSYCNTWAKNGIDKLGRASHTYAGWDADNQPAWQGSTAYSVGDLVRPTSTNSRSYRCYTAGTSSGSEPTWPTTAGGTVTDGSVTWKETTRTYTRFAHTYSVSAGVSASSTLYLPNKELATSAALAMLMHEPSATDFYAGGSYRSTAQSIIDAVVDTFCSCFTNSDGSMPYSDDAFSADLRTLDTLYGAFCTSTLATIYKLGRTSDWQVSPALNKGLDWLETGNYDTEPLSVTHRSGLGAGISPGGDIALRNAAYNVTNRSNDVLQLIYAACFNDVTTGYPTDYTQYGGGTAYPGYALEDIFDGLTLASSVLSTQTYTADAIVKNVQTYTADGLVKTVQTYTADAVVTSSSATQRTKTYTADGLVKAIPAKTYTADARINTGSPSPGGTYIATPTSLASPLSSNSSLSSPQSGNSYLIPADQHHVS